MQHDMPNILFLQADQLTQAALSFYGNTVCKTPNLDKIAKDGVVFENVYCNNPICAPSRQSMLSGRQSSSIESYSHGQGLSSSIPTFVHYLRYKGYQTSASGKMHFLGPDQLHGLEERLTLDFYPADYIFSENWEAESEGSTSSTALTTAGIVENCAQIAFDNETALRAEQKLTILAKQKNKNPFFLYVSFSNPHDPYMALEKYWNLYNDDDIDMPQITGIEPSKDDPHSQRIREHYGFDDVDLSPDQIKKLRHAYYANISFVDEKIGRLMNILKASGLDENTIIIFTSDHGDLLGERGMWWKKNFYEDAVRVPLIFHGPRYFKAKRIRNLVSLVDIFPTIIEFAGFDSNREVVSPIDGNSLSSLLERGKDENRSDMVFCENYAGSPAAMVMLRKGDYKYICSSIDPPLLYDLKNDPHELNNVAGDKDYQEIRKNLAGEIEKRYDLNKLHEKVLGIQKRNNFLQKSLSKGKKTYWDYKPAIDDSFIYKEHLNYNEWNVDCIWKKEN